MKKTINIERLDTNKSVSEYFGELFSDEEWSIFSDGYGYDKDDLDFIDASSEFYGYLWYSKCIHSRN